MTYSYNAKVIDVKTGDTFTASIDLGFGQVIEQEINMLGIEAPPLKKLDDEKVVQDPVGVASKKKLTELIKGKEVIIETRKINDTYSARVIIEGMQLPINEYMVRYGLATMKR